LSGLEIALVCALIVTTAAAAVATSFAIKFGMLILRVEDAIEDSLDVLEERYTSVNEIIEIPLFSDSPQIRQVHHDLRRSRDAILSIAHILINDFNTTEDDEDGKTTQEDT